MAAMRDRTRPGALHPFHAVLLAGTIPLFLGALLSDWAYSSTYQVQWTNLASGLIAGGLVFAGLVLVLALIGLFSTGHRGGRRLLYVLLVLRNWVLGFINALVHAKDAWAAMPTSLLLGRPVGTTVDPRGALIVADDLSNTIWRVTPAR